MNLKSVKILKVAVILCAIGVVAIAIAAPWMVTWYGELRRILRPASISILVSYYVCTAPVSVALWFMYRLLINIGRREPFHEKNASYVSVISWCCLAVAVICGCGGVFYPSLFFVCGSMLFLFLVVRVVCSCFAAAAKLQEENDLTV